VRPFEKASDRCSVTLGSMPGSIGPKSAAARMADEDAQMRGFPFELH
jgi:hypothetical protein